MFSTGTPQAPKTYRTIFIFSLFIIFCGVVSTARKAFIDVGPSVSVINQIFSVIHPIELRLGNLGRLADINLLNLVFYLMFGTGILMYMKNKRDDSGLLRFCLSFLFLFTLIRILNNLVAGYGIAHGSESFSVWTFILPLIYYSCIVLISWLCLKSLLTPFRESVTIEEVITPRRVDNGVRLLHLLIDLLVVALMIYPLTISFSFMLADMRPGPFNRQVFFLLLALFRLLYYLLFEHLGYATPAKFLTGTYVVDSGSGHLPNRMQITGRSFSRFIPFESFSFLGKEGWHDAFSKTTVVREHGRKYARTKQWWWLVLLIIALICAPLGNYIISERYQGRMNSIAEDHEGYRRQAILNNLSTEHVLVAERIGNYKMPYWGFKVTGLSNDSLILSKFALPKYASAFEDGLLEQYMRESAPSEDFRIPIQAVHEAFIPDENQLITIGDSGTTYHIEDILSVGIPVIRQGNSTSTRRTSSGECDKTFQMILSNRPAQITGIETLEGHITWTDAFPLVIELPEEDDKTIFHISAQHPCNKEAFIAEVHLESTEGIRYKYLLQKTDRDLFVSRKY